MSITTRDALSRLLGEESYTPVTEPTKTDKLAIATQRKQSYLASKNKPLPVDLQWESRPASSLLNIFPDANPAMHPEEEMEEGAISVNPHTPVDPLGQALKRLAFKGQENNPDPSIQIAYDPADPDPFPSPAYVKNAVTGERLDPYRTPLGHDTSSFEAIDDARMARARDLGLISDEDFQISHEASLDKQALELWEYRNPNADAEKVRINKDDPLNNLINKGAYGLSTVSSLAVGGINGALRIAEMTTDDPETLKTIKEAKGFFNKVDAEVASWVDRTNLEQAIENIDPEIEATTKSFDDTRKALEKEDYVGAAGHALSTLKSFGGAVTKFATEDPDAMLDVLAESLPQMWMAAKYLIGGTIVITARYFNDNIQAFTKEQGRPPTIPEEQKIFATSAGSAGLEAGSAKFTLAPFFKEGKKAVKTAEKATASAAKSTKASLQGVAAKKTLLGKTGAAAMLTGKAAVGTVGFTAKTAAKALKSLPVKRGFQDLAVEGLTEGLQTASEEYAKHLDVSKIDPKVVATGSILGAAAGGAIGVAGGSVEATKNALGETVVKAGESFQAARAKATGAAQQFTNATASKRDPVRAFDVERAEFAKAGSQEEAFAVISKLESHRDNLQRNIKSYFETNKAKISIDDSPEQQHVFDMQDSLKDMEADIDVKTSAAKFKMNPVESVDLDKAYSNLADPDTEYKSEDFALIANNILYGSEDFQGSEESINKILENDTIPSEVRDFLDAALEASKALRLYKSEDVKDGNIRDVRNEVGGEGKGGARFYARNLSNAVAQKKKDKFLNMRKRLDKFHKIELTKAHELRAEIANARQINQQILQGKEDGVDIAEISAQNNPIEVRWGTEANDNNPFIIGAQDRASDDTDLYELKGPDITRKNAEREASTLGAISKLFHKIPEKAFEGEQTNEIYAERTDGKTDAEAKRESQRKNRKSRTERITEDTVEDETEDTEPPPEGEPNSRKQRGNKRKRASDDFDDESSELGSETMSKFKPEIDTEFGSEQKYPEKKASPEFNKLPTYDPEIQSFIYAGIGSRDVENLNELGTKNIKVIARMLEREGYALNTGDADGADTLFKDSAKAAGGQPWVFTEKDATDTTREIAREIHPEGETLKIGSLNKMARNTNQLFGENLDEPVDFVLVWTPLNPDGIAPQHVKEIYYNPGHKYHTGGSGHTIAMADRKGIPVINMHADKDVWYPRLVRAMNGELGGVAEQPSAEGGKAASEENRYDSGLNREIRNQEYITGEDIEANPDVAYLFGDNDQESGYGGQAKEMRGKPPYANSYGIPTKKSPSTNKNAYYNNRDYEQNIANIDAAFAKIPSNMDVVVPAAGLGTNLADLKNKSRKTWEYLEDKLDRLFEGEDFSDGLINQQVQNNKKKSTRKQKGDPDLFEPVNPDLDYMHTDINIFQSMAYKSDDANAAKSKLSQDIQELLEEVPADQIGVKDPQIDGEYVRNIVNDMLFDFYEEFGWPTTQQTNINTAQGLSRDTLNRTPFDQLFTGKRKNPKSVLSTMPDFMEHTFAMDDESIKKINAKQGIDANLDDSRTAYRVIQDLYNEYTDNLGQVLNNNIKGKRYVTEKSSHGLMVDENGNLNPNVVSALVVASMGWLAKQANRSLEREDKGMTKFLGLRTGTYLGRYDNKIIGQLRQSGPLRDQTINDLGRIVMDQLNIGSLPQTDLNEEAHLLTSLGTLALDAMAGAGLVEHTKIYFSDLGSLDSINGKPGGDISKKFHPASKKFTRFVRALPQQDKNGKTQHTRDGKIWLDQGVRDLMNDTRDFSEIYDKLFDMQLDDSFPMDQPITRVDTQYKGTETQMSEYTEAAVENMQKVGWHNRPKLRDQLNRFPDIEVKEDDQGKYRDDVDYRLMIFGFEDPDLKHDTQYEGVTTTNDGLARQWEDYNNFLNSREDPNAAMYFKYFGVVNNRLHVSNPVINYQTSKIHRWLMAADSWINELDVSNYIGNESTALQEHKVAIVEAFGTSAKNTTRQKQLDDFHKRFIDKQGKLRSKFKAAVKLLNNEGITTFKKGQAETIYKAVKEGGEGAHTFAGLQALADLAQGIEKGDSKLEISLAREIDGTTNGVISALLQLVGDSTKSITNKGGISYKGDENADYAEYISKDINNDNYQEIAKLIFDVRKDFVRENLALRDKKAVKGKPTYNEFYTTEQEAVFSILGDMGKVVDDTLTEISSSWRELHKDPLMTLVYGASISKIMENFADLALKRFYTDLMENYTDKAKLTKMFTNLQDMGLAFLWSEQHPKTFFGQGDEVGVDEIVNKLYGNLEAARSWKFESFAEHQFMQKMETYYTRPMERALNDYIGDFVTMQNAINSAADFMNRVFVGLWTEEKARIREKYNRGYSEKERADFVKKQQKKGLVPGIATSTTDRTGDEQYTDYIQGTKTDKTVMFDKHNQEVQLQYTEDKLVTILDVISGKTNDQNTLDTDAYVRDYTQDIGVRFFTLVNHAMDSAVIQAALGHHNVQNIFDAFLSGSLTAQEISKIMNDSFLENHDNWSMSDAVHNQMEKFLKAYEGLEEEQQTEIVHGNKNIKLRPLVEYSYGFDGKVNGASLFDPALFLGNKISKNMNKGLTEFPKAMRGDFMPRLKKWHQAHLDNQAKITLGQQFPDGVAAASKGPAFEDSFHDGKSFDEQGSEDFDSTRNFEPKDMSVELNAIVAKETFHKLKDIGNVHDSLGHQTYLESMLNTSILPVMATMDAFTLHLGTTKTGERHVGSIKGQDIYLGANEGIQNTSSNPSPQEVYIHEMFHAVLRWGIEKSPKMRGEVRRMFELAERSPEIDYKVFLRKDADPNDMAEITEARRKYDYVFKNEGPGYLHEFASFGLSNEAFMAALAKVDTKKYRTIFEGTIPQRIAAVFGFIADMLKSLVKGRQPENARDGLIALAQNINGINNQSVGKFDQYWTKSWEAVNTPIANGLKNYMLKPYVKSVVKLSQGIQRRKAEGRPVNRFVDNYLITPYILPKEIIYDNFLGTLSEVAWDMGLTMDNVAHHFLTEVRGPTIISKKYHKFLREGKHAIDAAVEQKAGSITDILTNAYSRELTDKEWMSLTSVILKSDLSTLVGTYSMQRIRNMLASNGAVNSELDALKKALRALDPINAEFYINQAKSLGGFMALGKDGVGMTMHNAYTIAHMQHLEGFGYNPGDNVDQAEDLIDKIATLSAIKATNKDAKKDTIKIIEEEFKRNVETNGIELLLKMHDTFKKNSLELLFNGNKTLMMKGWTREMYDEYKSFQIGTEAQKREFAEQGFVMMDKVEADNLYTRTPQQYMYVSKDGLRNRRVTGNLGLTNKIGKGHDLLSLAYQEIKADPKKGGKNPNTLARKHHNAYKKRLIANVAKQFAGEIDMDYTNNWLVPLLNGSGDIHTYRYTMSEQTKVQALGKRDLANTVMGRMHGSLIAKPATTKQNTSVIQYAFDDWKKNYADDTRQFVHISSDSKKSKHRDLFHLLPTDTFRELERIWGNDVREGFYIREDLMYLIGGFRKASFTDWLDVHTGEILPGKLKHIMRLSGTIWEKVVATGKRNIILFLPQIVTDNTYSNTVFLMMRGVPPEYTIKKQHEAVKLLLDYQADLKKRNRLETLIEIDPGHSKTKSRKLTLDRLKRNMDKNPVGKLIDAGLFQALSEDLSTSAVENYESSIKKAVGNAFPVAEQMIDTMQGRIPKTWKDVYNFAIFDPKDPMAQAITKATLFSDFAARYALYSYRTEQQKHKIPEGVSEEQWAELAIEEAQDVFVNYDDPTSPEMQWLNDMGVIMFTKYMFRMLRIAARPLTAAARLESLQKRADEQIQQNMDKDAIGTTLGMKILEDTLVGGADIYDNSLLMGKSISDNMFGPWHHLMNAATPNSFRFANGILEMMPGSGE